VIYLKCCHQENWISCTVSDTAAVVIFVHHDVIKQGHKKEEMYMFTHLISIVAYK